MNEGGKPDTTNCWLIDEHGDVHRRTVPAKQSERHWDEVRAFLTLYENKDGPLTLVEPIRYLEESHGVIYVDEEGSMKYPMNPTLTLLLGMHQMYHGPAVILDTAINQDLQGQLQLLHEPKRIVPITFEDGEE